MRTTIALATFLVAGAGAVGVSALDLKGSDTLEGITKALLLDATLDCGGTGNNPVGGLVYVGTGSSNGEGQIIGNTQQVAPMSRFLNPAVAGTTQVCTLPNTPAAPGGPSESTAEGIVFALDGLSIVVSDFTGGTDACNGAAAASCSPSLAKGLAFGNIVINVPGYVCPALADTTPFNPADPGCVNGQYRLLDSQDVLRLVYFGLDHDFKAIQQRNCGNGDASVAQYARNPGLVRAVLVETWGNLFRDSANCTGCTRLWRAFRRNDESGTTDTFVSLMGRTAICGAVSGACTSMGQTVPVAVPSIDQAARRSLFCNTRQASAVQCVTGGQQGGFDMVANPNGLPYRLLALTTLNASSPADAEPPPPPTAPGGPATPAAVNPKIGAWDFPDSEFGPIGNAPYFTDFQDFDCIRRECSTPGGATQQEQVCSARGDMGLVIPIWDPPTATALMDPFALPTCNGTWQAVQAPACNGANPSICPNGEKPVGAVCAANNPGTCLQPYIGTAPNYDFRCVNPANNFFGGQRRVDGRVYNLHVHSNDTAVNPDYPYATVTRQNPDSPGSTIQVRLVGAYYRIHQQNFLATARPNHFVLRKAGDFTPLAAGVAADSTPGGATGACNPTTMAPGVVSATRLIGCYAGSADRCAIGFAGGEAALLPGADALRVNGVGPDPTCVRAFITNPLDPNGYALSRKLYLNTVKGFENVTGDEAKLARCFANRNIVDPKVVAAGFITRTANVADGTQCQDFDEVGICGAAAGVNACLNNPAGIPTN